MSQRGVAFATAPRRLRGAVAATSLRRLHEPFIRSLRGPSRWVEPRMQLLGLCSFDARRKSRFLVLGAKKRRFFGAPKKKKSRRKIFWGDRKSYLAAEHHNEAAPKKKKAAEKKKLGAKKNFGGRKCFWGGRKSYLAVEHHNKTAPKKKKKKIRLGAEKYDFRPPKEQRPSNFLSRPS